MVFLAIFTGAMTLLNYYWQANYTLSAFLSVVSLAAQFILAVLTITAVIGYKGRRNVPAPGGWYNYWTFRFCIIIISLIGNIGVLVVFMLHAFGVIESIY